MHVKIKIRLALLAILGTAALALGAYAGMRDEDAREQRCVDRCGSPELTIACGALREPEQDIEYSICRAGESGRVALDSYLAYDEKHYGGTVKIEIYIDRERINEFDVDTGEEGDAGEEIERVPEEKSDGIIL